ncbi:unnamed protein product [Vitrella brassicaformis CCMP3155]|uniref:J domain-containing protein n=1 Tax=Vitrella brassicaformis (strain CCMP3155) TaxID=1169540 RepID=A0A0G4F9P6_VITBC|nr:unnamed protein product [Vitrella brassicaformis CCMP3155]|eukprot:CEM08986.1 unnamed protein product [Vitrella brassicaformis CCMP3155]
MPLDDSRAWLEATGQGEGGHHPSSRLASGCVRRAAVADIKARFHERCLKCHPDKGGSSAAFRELYEAYKVACGHLIGGSVGGGRQKVFVTELEQLRAQNEEAKRKAAPARAAGKEHLEKLREMCAREDAGEELDKTACLKEAHRADRAAAEEAKRTFDKATAAGTRGAIHTATCMYVWTPYV